VGQNSAEIYAEKLGMSAAEFEQLLKRGVV